jgi:hypothetical protein
VDDEKPGLFVAAPTPWASPYTGVFCFLCTFESSGAENAARGCRTEEPRPESQGVSQAALLPEMTGKLCLPFQHGHRCTAQMSGSASVFQLAVQNFDYSIVQIKVAYAYFRRLVKNLCSDNGRSMEHFSCLHSNNDCIASNPARFYFSEFWIGNCFSYVSIFTKCAHL